MEKPTIFLCFKCKCVVILEHLCPCFSTLSPKHPFQFFTANVCHCFYIPAFLSSFSSLLYLCYCPAVLSLTHCPSPFAIQVPSLLHCHSTSWEEHRELRRVGHSCFLIFCPGLIQLQWNQRDAIACYVLFSVCVSMVELSGSMSQKYSCQIQDSHVSM